MYKNKEKLILMCAVGRRDISNILHSSDFFVMTSLWEGLPISTIEALSCGLVPIVNDVDGQREIIKDGYNGFLIKPHDIKSIERFIYNFINRRFQFKIKYI